MFINRSSVLTAKALLLSVALVGCRLGGNVTNSLESVSPSSDVVSPVVASPNVSPYYSSGNSVVISGACTTGDAVVLSGPTHDQTSCSASTFTFTLNQTSDGVYSYVITQNAPHQGASTPANFTWVRKSSVAPPSITYPSASPFLSGLAQLSIAGACENGATVSLTGDGSGSVVCANSMFSITLPKSADGDYTIGVNQTDLAGNSAASSVVWKKHVLAVSPNNPGLVVGKAQYLTITGGAPPYNVVVTTSNSGGTYNSTTGYYLTGHLANVVDTLTVTDSLSTTATVTVTTQPDIPDHLVLPALSGAAQVGIIGQPLASSIKVQITDQYGNGLPFIPVFFRPFIGDAAVTSTPLVVSDSNGYVTATVRLGYQSPINGILVGNIGTPFPDAAQTGNGSIIITESYLSKGTGKIGSSFATGSNPGAFVVSDFNGDGYPDLAVLNINDPSVGIFLGKGNGTFSTMTKVTGLCSGPNSIAAGDFNNDSKTDLILVCSGSDKYALIFGNGTGTFQTPIVVATGASETVPMAVAVGDFDHDGNLDFAIATVGGQNVGIRYGTGTGSFSAPVEYAVGAGPGAIIAIDLNKDGYLDLAVANGNANTVSVLFNNQTSRTFTASPQGQISTGVTPVALVGMDLNADGWNDLVVLSNSESSVYIYLNDQTGGLQQNATVSVGSSPTWAAIGDFNGDGHVDVVVANSGDNTALILNGDGFGNLLPGAVIPTETGPVFIGAGDVDKDGHTDIIVTAAANQVVQVIPNQGSSVFGYTASVGNGPNAGVTADFNGDGIPDAAILNSGSNNITILKGKPIGFTGKSNGFFTLMNTLTTGASPSAIAAADLNNDGYMDLVVASSTAGSIRVYLGNGDGTFKPFTTYGVGSSPSGIAIQDFNGDGYMDIAVANSSSSTVSILTNARDGTFGTKSDFHVGNGPSAIVAGNFNGDHNIDLAVADFSAGTVSILLGNGNGTFQAYTDYAVSDGPISLVTGDFNADGKLDLAVANSSAGTVSILMGVGDGSFVTHADYACGSTPTGIVAGDFNGDGKTDLAVANGPALTMTVLFNNASTFNIQSSLSTNVSTNGLVVGDWNKDGSLDLLVLDVSNNAVETWMGH